MDRYLIPAEGNQLQYGSITISTDLPCVVRAGTHLTSMRIPSQTDAEGLNQL